MASWKDGAAYAPTERPDGFATPSTEPLDAAPVRVHEIPRVERDGVAISASEVRRRLANKDLVALAGLVPAPTLALLTTKVQADRPRAELVPAAVG